MPKIVDHDLRKDEIAEATWRVVAGKGLDGATVREIASEAGCSTGVLAHYFRDKSALLLYALNLVWNRAANRMEEVGRDLQGLAALRAVLLEALPTTEESRLEWRVWLSFWGRAVSDASLAAEQEARYAVWQRLITSLVLGGQRQGSIAADTDAQEVAESLIALIDGVGVQATLESARLTPERQTAIINRYLALLTE